jgi:hypothetical protein
MIILPRQARDKHRENSRKDGVFRTPMETSSAKGELRGLLVPWKKEKNALCSLFPVFVASLSWQKDRDPIENVMQNGIFEPFIFKNDHFAKTCSGQT